MTHIVTIQSLTFNGLGRGFLESGEEVHVLGAFPEETVRVRVFGTQMGALQGVVEDVIKPSPYRIEPQEPHYMHTSPWQALAWEQENSWKQEIVQNIFAEVADTRFLPHHRIVYDDRMYGYRNAVEFNVVGTGLKPVPINLALLKRGRKEYIPVHGSALASDAVNTAGQYVITELNKHQVPATSIKQITIRSNRLGECLIGMYVTDPEFVKTFPQISLVHEKIRGGKIYYSDPAKNRNETTQLLLSQGEQHILEYVLGKTLAYGVTDFFQLNVPVFEQAVKRIKEQVTGEHVVDFYSGVGAIGIAISDSIVSGVLVESSELATQQAQKNITANNIQNMHAYAGTAKDLCEYITHDKTIILDPPRQGLESEVIERIRSEKPHKIVYLSCKPYTQANDVAQLLDLYTITFAESYNFFPRTPHVENLVILEGNM